MKVAITFLMLLIWTSAFCQNKVTKRTYDYLTLFERWKLISKTDKSFVLTTNDLFWADTAITISGKLINEDTSVQFLVDTSAVKNKFLLRRKVTNEQLIAQGDKLSSFKHFILFKNALRRVYNTSAFSTTIHGTYYRGDGKWTNQITLNKDNTYKISESVHANEEYTETGKWNYENGFVMFVPNAKSAKWLNKVCR
jgi:hypothetical protein